MVGYLPPSSDDEGAPRPRRPRTTPVRPGGPGRVERFAHEGLVVETEELPGERRGPAPVFLLVHGIGMGRTVFGALADILRRHGTVLTLDQPGYGASPEPEPTASMAWTADVIAAWLRSHGRGPVVAVGHSMGSQVVAELAVRHPEAVSRLVLVAPTVDRHARRLGVQLHRLARDLVGESPRVLVVGGREYLRAGPHLRRKLGAMLEHRPELLYPRIQAPTLVLRGSRDPVSPLPWCLEVAAAIPEARLEQVEGHGHEAMIRDPEQAAALILRFVADATHR
ncbi:MAG: alpha/beta hydrolase [Microbacteriaceae bacterium]